MMTQQQGPTSAMSWKCTSAGCLGLAEGPTPAHTPPASPRSTLAVTLRIASHETARGSGVSQWVEVGCLDYQVLECLDASMDSLRALPAHTQWKCLRT